MWLDYIFIINFRIQIFALNPLNGLHPPTVVVCYENLAPTLACIHKYYVNNRLKHFDFVSGKNRVYL